jgi:hypothetical protein
MLSGADNAAASKFAESLRRFENFDRDIYVPNDTLIAWLDSPHTTHGGLSAWAPHYDQRGGLPRDWVLHPRPSNQQGVTRYHRCLAVPGQSVDAEYPMASDDTQEDMFARRGRISHDIVYSFALPIQEDSDIGAEYGDVFRRRFSDQVNLK